MAASRSPDPYLLGRAAWALLLLGGVAAACAALARGSWFDEYWSLYLGDPGLSSAETWRRWLTDSHPPLANALYRVVMWIAGGDLVRDRLLLNIPPFLGLVAATALFHRRSPSGSLFYLLFALVAVALPGFAAGASEFRSYAWQICADAVALQFIHFATREDRGMLRGPELAVGSAAIAIATFLHFISGAIVGLALLGLIVDGWRRGDWRRLLIPTAVCVLCWAAMVGTVAVQLPQVRAALDVNWAATSSAAAAGMFVRAFGLAVLVAPVPAWIAVRRRGEAGRFVAILLGAAAVSLVGLLALNALRPVLMDRYLLAWQLLVLGAIVALAAPELERRPRALGLFLAWTALMIALSAALQARAGGWESTRDRIAANVRACPGTAVYAASPWRLGPARTSSTAAREHPVFALGYDRLARADGFQVTMLPDEPVILPLASPCPTLVWIEHDAPGRPGTILRRGDIRFDAPARLRLVVGATGYVIVATPLAGHAQAR